MRLMREVWNVATLATAAAIAACTGGGTAVGTDVSVVDIGDAGVPADMPQAPDVRPVLPGELSIVACPGAPMITVPSAAPTCDTICGAAHCVPARVGGNGPDLPDCPDDGTGAAGKCIPDLVFASGGRYASMPCTSSIIPGMGACVPYCLAGAFKDILHRDNCAAAEVCSPCTNPMTHQPTGACVDRCAPRDGGLDSGAPADIADVADVPDVAVD